MIDSQTLKDFFDFGSFGPLFLFVLGVYSTSLFATNNHSLGVFVIMLAFIVYIASNLYIKTHREYDTYFNEYLEDMAIFLTFGISTIIFGLVYFGSNPLFLAVIFFYAIGSILSVARNSILNLKNTRGYPLVLNGIFFPLIYYFYLFYLDAMGSSIFLVFYILIGFLLLSDYNFLSRESSHEIYDKVVEKEKEFVGMAGKIYENKYNDVKSKFGKDETKDKTDHKAHFKKKDNYLKNKLKDIKLKFKKKKSTSF